jgi:hypothetical protein
MNLCRACGEDFASVAAFDRHRVGVHTYTFTQGLLLDPPVEDGRRCMDEEELYAAGMELDRYACWSIAADAERARNHFSAVRVTADRLAETGAGGQTRRDRCAASAAMNAARAGRFHVLELSGSITPSNRHGVTSGTFPASAV